MADLNCSLASENGTLLGTKFGSPSSGLAGFRSVVGVGSGFSPGSSRGGCEDSTSGALGAVWPSGLGAPGALGSALGSNASLALRAILAGGRGGDVGRRRDGQGRGLARLLPDKRNSTSSRKRRRSSASLWFWFCNSSIWPLARRNWSSSRPIRNASAPASLCWSFAIGMSEGGSL